MEKSEREASSTHPAPVPALGAAACQFRDLRSMPEHRLQLLAKLRSPRGSDPSTEMSNRGAAQPHSGIAQFGGGDFKSRQSTYKARGRPQIPKRNKPKDEDQRRRTIGQQGKGPRPMGRRPRPAPNPANNVQPDAPNQEIFVPPHHQDQDPLINPLINPLDHVGPDEALVLENDVEHPDHFIIDMGEEEPRGIGERIRDKAFGGRTFGDSSNLLGAVANTISDTAESSALLTIGSSGVLASGCKLLFDGLTQLGTATASEDKREAGYTVLMGLSNMASGAYGIESAILTLLEHEASASLAGVLSTATWALTEATNIILQLDILITNIRQGKSYTAYLKPIAALLASLLKCIGGVLYVYGTIVSADRQDDEDDPTVNIGVVLMIVGSAMSTLHGIIKLIGMCLEKCRDSGVELDDEPDLELGGHQV